MQLLIVPKHQFLDANGDPLSGGKLYSYQAGTSTPLDTYTDQGGGTANTNPVILDSAGRADVWLDSSVSYKIALYDADDSLVWTVDDIDYLPDGFVTAAKLATDSVITAKIVDLAVTTAKINDLAVTTAKLAADSVTTAKIADSNVTTAKIADGAITPEKLGDLNIETPGTGSSTFSTTSTSEVDVTNLTDSITTNGRPVLVILQPTTGGGSIRVSTGPATGGVRVYRDSTLISSSNFINLESSLSYYSGFSFVYIDQPSAGTYVYKVTADTSSGDTFYITNYQMFLVEL